MKTKLLILLPSIVLMLSIWSCSKSSTNDVSPQPTPTPETYKMVAIVDGVTFSTNTVNYISMTDVNGKFFRSIACDLNNARASYIRLTVYGDTVGTYMGNYDIEYAESNNKFFFLPSYTAIRIDKIDQTNKLISGSFVTRVSHVINGERQISGKFTDVVIK